MIYTGLLTCWLLLMMHQLLGLAFPVYFPCVESFHITVLLWNCTFSRFQLRYQYRKSKQFFPNPFLPLWTFFPASQIEKKNVGGHSVMHFLTRGHVKKWVITLAPHWMHFYTGIKLLRSRVRFRINKITDERKANGNCITHDGCVKLMQNSGWSPCHALCISMHKLHYYQLIT